MPTKKKIVEDEVITEIPKEAVEAEPVVTAPEVVVEPEPVVEASIPSVSAPMTTPVISSEPVKKEGSWWMLLIAFILGLAVGAVTMYLVKAQSSKVSSQQETAVVDQTPEPTTAPVTEVKREDLKVQVLNGSGVSGAAAQAKTLLEGLGYLDVETGNADGDFAETEIEIKADKAAVEVLVKKDLEDEYSLSDTVGELDESSDYDVVITLGAE